MGRPETVPPALEQTSLVQLKARPGARPAFLRVQTCHRLCLPLSRALRQLHKAPGQQRVLGDHQPVPQPHRRLEVPSVRAWPHIATQAGSN